MHNRRTYGTDHKIPFCGWRRTNGIAKIDVLHAFACSSLFVEVYDSSSRLFALVRPQLLESKDLVVHPVNTVYGKTWRR